LYWEVRNDLEYDKLSNDVKAVLAVAREEKPPTEPTEIIKGPSDLGMCMK
jgi:hypothetical protein